MTKSYEVDAQLLSKATSDQLEEAKGLLKSLGLGSDDIEFVPIAPTEDPPTAELPIHTYNLKTDILKGLGDVFSKNGTTNVCELGWDAFAAAAKIAAATLPVAGSAVVMFVINRIWLELRATCKN